MRPGRGDRDFGLSHGEITEYHPATNTYSYVGYGVGSNFGGMAVDSVGDVYMDDPASGQIFEFDVATNSVRHCQSLG